MLVVVGGHSRNIGKTSVVEGLIRELREYKWNAVKITQFGHGVCATHEIESCGCETEDDAPFALTEEYEPSSTDSGRFLGAGAERSFWLRTPMGELHRAAGAVSKLLAQSPNVIVESNSLLELISPDIYLMVMDTGCLDVKPTSLRFMGRADAFLVIDRGIGTPVWQDLATGLWDEKPHFQVKPPLYVPPAVVQFVKARLALTLA